tara:strand:+ start:134 stop:412 length:279 start_codon:yes stop_codon:yes gene_type:complete
MEYYIIDKIEYINDVVTYTPIGYTTSLDNSNFIHDNHEVIFLDWIKQNKEKLESGDLSVSVFFDNIPFIYTSSQQTNSIEGMELNEINITEL